MDILTTAIKNYTLIFAVCWCIVYIEIYNRFGMYQSQGAVCYAGKVDIYKRRKRT